jgi:acyl-CoA synthetase (AMP-forming)/AMP-acid ligase II
MKTTTFANLFPDPASPQPAIILEDSGVAISYRALSDQIDRLAGEFRGSGLRDGDAIAFVLPNGPELLVLLLALARAGLIAVPLNPAFKAEELHDLLADVQARAVLTTSGNGVVAEGAAALGIAWSPTPLATVSAPRGHSPPCVYRGMCVIGCSTNAKQSVLMGSRPSSTPASIIRRLRSIRTDIASSSITTWSRSAGTARCGRNRRAATCSGNGPRCWNRSPTPMSTRSSRAPSAKK